MCDVNKLFPECRKKGVLSKRAMVKSLNDLSLAIFYVSNRKKINSGHLQALAHAFNAFTGCTDMDRILSVLYPVSAQSPEWPRTSAESVRIQNGRSVSVKDTKQTAYRTTSMTHMILSVVCQEQTESCPLRTQYGQYCVRFVTVLLTGQCPLTPPWFQSEVIIMFSRSQPLTTLIHVKVASIERFFKFQICNLRFHWYFYGMDSERWPCCVNLKF